MAVKYYSDFSDDDGRLWHITINDQDYTGSSPVSFTVGADGFALRYEGSDTNRSAAILPSTVEFSYYIQNGNDDALLTNLAGSAEGRFMVEIWFGGDTYSEGDLFWRGTLLSDISDFVDEYYPQEFRLLAIDDLASLRNLPYETVDTGYVSIRGLLANFLNKMRVWDITSDTHRATLASWLEAKDTGGTYRDIWQYGEMNMVSFNNTDTVPTSYRDTYEALEGILSAFGARLYWRGSMTSSVPSSFVIDALNAQQYDDDLLTGFTLNSSGTLAATTLTRQTINLDSTGIKRLRGFRKGFLNPLQRVERSFTYAHNPFVVDHEYSGVPDSNNFHNGTYDAELHPAPTIEYETGSRVSLRFRAVFTHTAGSQSATAFNTVSKRAGRFKIVVNFKLGQYYANRDLTIQGTTNTWVPQGGDYCPVVSFTEDDANWATSAAGNFIEFYTPVLVWTQEESKTFDMGLDLPPLPADLTSDDCTISFDITPVDADGLGATYTADIGNLFDDNPPQFLKVTMYPTDIFQTDGSNITFKVDNDNSAAREVLTLPAVYLSDKLGSYGGGLFLNVSNTRSQPSDWQSPNNLGLDENLHNLVAKEWLEGQSDTLRKMSGEVRDFRSSSNSISLLDTITHESVNYSIQRLEFEAARGTYILDLLELKNGGAQTVQEATFSDGFPGVISDNGRPDTSPVTDVIIGDLEEKTSLITITQAVDLDTLESDVSDNSSNITSITNVLKTAFSGDGAGVYADSGKSITASHMSLTSTTAKIQAGGGNTAIDLTESSPGSISLAVQVGSVGNEVSATAIDIQGTTGSQLPNITFSGNVSGISYNDLDDLPTLPSGDLLNDTTPQLGGDLDVNGNEISSVSNGHIILNPNGTGEVRLDKSTGDAILQVNHITNGQNSRLELTEGNGAFGAFFNYDSTEAYIGSINGSDVKSIKIKRAGDLEILKAATFASPATFKMTVDNDAVNYPIELKDENSQTQVFYLKNSGIADEVDMYLAGDIDADGTITAGAVTYPNTDGNAGEILKTDGSGSVSFGTLAIGDLSNVSTTGATVNQVLKWDGTNWSPADDEQGGGGGGSDSFNTISISGQTDVVADSGNDTLTLVAGTNLVLTTNATTDSITFATTNSPTFTGTASITGIALGSTGILGTGTIQTTGNLATLGSGTLSVAGTSSFSGNATFNSNLYAAGIQFVGNGTNTIGPSNTGGSQTDLQIESNGNVTVVLDDDDNETGQAFIVKNGAGTIIFQVDEDGFSSGLFTTTTPTIATISDFESTQTGTITVSNYDSDATYQIKLYDSSGTEQTTQTITDNSDGTWSITNGPILTGAYIEIKALEFGKLVSAVATSNSFNITAAATQQRYWRLQITNASKTPIASTKIALGNFRLYTATGGGGTAYPANMTSTTTPSPYVVSSGYYFSGYEDYKAFDGSGSSAGSMWWTLGTHSASNAWIQIDLGSSIDLAGGECQISTSGGWTDANYAVLYGSNTGAFTGEEREMAFFQNIDKPGEQGGTFTTYTEAIT